MHVCDVTGAPKLALDPLGWWDFSGTHSPTKCTRYGDDYTISSKEETFCPQLIANLKRVITAHGFRLNDSKERVGHHGILWLPGVVIIHGEIRPKLDSFKPLINSLLSGQLTKNEAKGWLGYLKPFGKPGRRALRFLGKSTGHDLYAILQRIAHAS